LSFLTIDGGSHVVETKKGSKGCDSKREQVRSSFHGRPLIDVEEDTKPADTWYQEILL
jgi:hypothetical protein